MKRILSTSQRQRIQDHSVSVAFSKNGTLKTTSSHIITPNGNDKLNNQISVIPTSTEKVDILSTTTQYFKNLEHVNIILTNACNLSCDYCYEQHNRDFGRFTPESLKLIYDFQFNVNDNEGKMFQFFGGEPLIHSQLILDFIRKYHIELEANRAKINISMITNGILLTSAFISEYFSHKFSQMSISLDTINANIDHRQIGQEKIDNIIHHIGLIPTYFKDQHNVSIRCTISIETAPELLSFIQKIYDQGIRTMVIHPLTMSSVDGFIKWPEDSWNKLHQDIVTALEFFPNFEIQFSEGVGMKKGSNCMIGSDMIAVDGSGDYSGCYFFTNHKETVGHTILGNILTDVIYVDRYATFQQEYDNMFEDNEQCKTCELSGLCYQCPAGNLDSGDGKMFRPDDMCQDIVKLFLTLQNDIVKKSFITKFTHLSTSVGQQGEQVIFAKSIIYLMVKYYTGVHLPEDYLRDMMNILPKYTLILKFFILHIHNKDYIAGNIENYFDEINNISEGISIDEFYIQYIDINNIQNEASKQPGNIDDITKRVFYLTLTHLVILNPKGDKFK